MRYNQTTEQPGAVQLFTHPSFGTIRTAGDADNPLFCLKDLCKCLDLQAGAVSRRLAKGMISSHPLQTKGGLQYANFVNEPGIFKVIFQSRKPEAEEFTNWVASVVLPSIRKTGHYGVAPANPAPVSLEDFKQSLVSTMQELVIKTVAETLKTYMPVVPTTIKPSILGTPRPAPAKTWSLGEMSKELGVDSYYLKCLLVSIKAVKSTRHEVVFATSNMQELFANLPYFVPYTGGVERWDGIIVTEKGRKEILNCLPTYKKQHPYL